MDWIDVAFANAVMNFQLSQNAGECPGLAEDLLASQEDLCSME
jgi:hypothetical protein